MAAEKDEVAAPRRRWGLATGWRLLVRTLSQMQRHNTSQVAAGCAFYATLALFPALSTLVSVYGLAFDPASVERQMELLRGLLPPDAFTLIADQVRALVARPPGALGLRLTVGLAVALWSASAGTKAMLSSLNTAYGAAERRGTLRFEATGLVITLAGILGAVLALALLVALPAVAAFLRVAGAAQVVIHTASLLVLVLYVAVLLGSLYRFGPSPRGLAHGTTPGRLVLPGVVLATLLWLSTAAAVSYYVADFAGFDVTYGSLAAVAGVMLWFWASCYVVLAGAEFNAVLGARHRWPEG
ncbi:MAG: hypothetical protein BGP12_18720 [Rhodospirillales bacterium 70-18]|nr:MAG: hypothetical protein BGP12_18720 [Rhodospirillales bacterium 70-18]